MGEKMLAWIVVLLVVLLTGYSCHGALEYARRNGRQIGHGDVWATICEKRPEIAEQLLDEIGPVDEETGIPYHCSDFAHHFDKYE